MVSRVKRVLSVSHIAHAYQLVSQGRVSIGISGVESAHDGAGGLVLGDSQYGGIINGKEFITIWMNPWKIFGKPPLLSKITLNHLNFQICQSLVVNEQLSKIRICIPYQASGPFEKLLASTLPVVLNEMMAISDGQADSIFDAEPLIKKLLFDIYGLDQAEKFHWALHENRIYSCLQG